MRPYVAAIVVLLYCYNQQTENGVTDNSHKGESSRIVIETEARVTVSQQ